MPFEVAGKKDSPPAMVQCENAGRFADTLSLKVAGVTGLEPATSGVTGRRSNQLSYTPDANS